MALLMASVVGAFCVVVDQCALAVRVFADAEARISHTARGCIGVARIHIARDLTAIVAIPGAHSLRIVACVIDLLGDARCAWAEKAVLVGAYEFRTGVERHPVVDVGGTAHINAQCDQDHQNDDTDDDVDDAQE